MNDMANRKAGLSALISGPTGLQDFGKNLEDSVKNIGTSSNVETVVTSEKEAPEISMINGSSEVSEKFAYVPVFNASKGKVRYENVRVSEEQHRAIKLAAVMSGTTVTDYLYRILEDFIFRNDLRKYSHLSGAN